MVLLKSFTKTPAGRVRPISDIIGWGIIGPTDHTNSWLAVVIELKTFYGGRQL